MFFIYLWLGAGIMFGLWEGILVAAEDYYFEDKIKTVWGVFVRSAPTYWFGRLITYPFWNNSKW